MPFNYNGSTVNGVTYNGSPVNKVNYNGVTVWENQPAPAWGGLCFTAEEANSTVELTVVGTPSIANTAYSTDGTNWTTFTPSTAGTNTVTLANIGDKVYFRNDINANFSSSRYLKFVMDGKIAASGNCNSMYVHEGFEDLTELTYKQCFRSMFAYCTSLTTAPELPATTLASDCYNNMFYGCTSLTTITALPATTLTSYCYSNMFCGCTSLTTIPELPATTLAGSCYNSMFKNCTNIKMSLTYDAAEYPNTYTFGANPSSYALSMFLGTGGSFKDNPTVQTLYTANTIV